MSFNIPLINKTKCCFYFINKWIKIINNFYLNRHLLKEK